MTALESDRPRRKAPAILLLLLIIIGLLSGAYYLAPRFERDAPHITLAPDSDVLGPAPVVIGIVDQGTGLKSVTATLLVAGSDHTLAAEQYAEPVREKKVIVDPSKLAGVKDGRAVLRVSARDGSLWKFFGGNEAVFQKDLTIDITPPTVELIADDRYINLGGVGAIVYKASADTVSSGVRIADYFFPGDQGQVKDHPDRFIAFFAAVALNGFMSSMATLGCPGRVSEPAKSARRRVFGRMTTVPSLSIVKAILSPDLSPSRSRISRGTVTWPLLVIVVASAMSGLQALRRRIT